MECGAISVQNRVFRGSVQIVQYILSSFEKFLRNPSGSLGQKDAGDADKWQDGAWYVNETLPRLLTKE